VAGQDPFKWYAFAADAQFSNKRLSPGFRIIPHSLDLEQDELQPIEAKPSNLKQLQNALFCYELVQIVLFTPVHLWMSVPQRTGRIKDHVTIGHISTFFRRCRERS
jgi:hypothetical protein